MCPFHVPKLRRCICHHVFFTRIQNAKPEIHDDRKFAFEFDCWSIKHDQGIISCETLVASCLMFSNKRIETIGEHIIIMLNLNHFVLFYLHKFYLWLKFYDPKAIETGLILSCYFWIQHRLNHHKSDEFNVCFLFVFFLFFLQFFPFYMCDDVNSSENTNLNTSNENGGT